MPIYEFKCDKCKAEREILLPVSEAGKQIECECGQVMRRKFSVSINPHFKKTGRDKVLATLNREEGGYTYPGGDKHRARYDQALARGLDPPKYRAGMGMD